MTEFGSLIFYIISFVFSSIFYYHYNEKNKKVFLLLSFLIPLLIGGFRYYVGTDYYQYVGMFERNSNVDIGFNLITKISKIFGDFRVMFFIYNFLTLLFIFLGLKNFDSKTRPLIYFCYLFLTYTSTYNIIRQGLAMSIIFYAYKFIEKKDVKNWIIFILLATCFHSTALLCLPFYFFFKSNNILLKIILIILVTICTFNFEELLNFISTFSIFSHYAIYAKESIVSSENKILLVNIATLIYVLIHRKHLENYNNKNKIYILIYIVAIIILITGNYNLYVKRISSYFLLSKYILLGSIPAACKSKKSKLLNTIFILAYCILLFTIQIYFLKQGNAIPYDFKIWGD